MHKCQIANKSITRYVEEYRETYKSLIQCCFLYLDLRLRGNCDCVLFLYIYISLYLRISLHAISPRLNVLHSILLVKAGDRSLVLEFVLLGCVCMYVFDRCFCIEVICHPTGVFQQLCKNRLDRPVALWQFVEEGTVYTIQPFLDSKKNFGECFCVFKNLEP